ncbi:hypothetical protein IMZ48_37335 [Candidatus Bathyarchaeota archaeon]|nr:hypothetical protein [Candidatus Bathyarchaeota archaeon]
MADKSKRAVNGQGKPATPATGPPGALGNKFAADLRGLTAQLQDLVKSTGGVQEYGALLEAKDSLEKKLQDRQSEVSQLSKDAEDSKKKHITETSEMRERIKQLEARTAWLQDDYGRKYTEWSKSSNSHEATYRELSEAQCKLRESQKAAAAARSETDTLRRDYKKQESDLDDSIRHYASYQKKLQIRDLEVEELEHRVDSADIERRNAVERLGILPLDSEDV